MRFATIVFRIAAIWGIPLLTILYFLFGIVPTGPVAVMTYPQTYFGFLTITMVWQIAFLVIASDPVRFRPMMIPAILEKLGWVAMLLVLVLIGRAGIPELTQSVPDAILGVLFVIAFVKTPVRQHLPAGELSR